MSELVARGSAGRVRVQGAWLDDLPLPLLVYRGALEAPDAERARAEAQSIARAHGWDLSWTNPQGVAAERHCHTTTHEAVFVLRGKARVRYGARGDTVVELSSGDVAFHPAGTFHQGAGDEGGVITAGAYPTGAADWDWHTGRLGPDELSRIRAIEEPQHPIASGRVTDLAARPG